MARFEKNPPKQDVILRTPYPPSQKVYIYTRKIAQH